MGNFKRRYRIFLFADRNGRLGRKIGDPAISDYSDRMESGTKTFISSSAYFTRGSIYFVDRGARKHDSSLLSDLERIATAPSASRRNFRYRNPELSDSDLFRSDGCKVRFRFTSLRLLGLPKRIFYRFQRSNPPGSAPFRYFYFPGKSATYSMEGTERIGFPKFSRERIYFGKSIKKI